MTELSFNQAAATTSTPHEFTFFTNYAQVLLLIASEPDVRMRELAFEVGITERAIQRIIEDLIVAGYLTVHKNGRRNQYAVHSDLPLKRLLFSHRTVGDLVRFVQDSPAQERKLLAM